MQNTETSWKTEGTVSESELERKLASILQNTEGVGRVQVLLMTGGEQKGFYDTDKAVPDINRFRRRGRSCDKTEHSAGSYGIISDRSP